MTGKDIGHFESTLKTSSHLAPKKEGKKEEKKKAHFCAWKGWLIPREE